MLSSSYRIRSSLKKSLDALMTDSDDIKKRKKFIQLLSKNTIPMPQKEGEWHAARIYIDEKKDSFYDIEQWEDYLKLINKHPTYSQQNKLTRTYEYTDIHRKLQHKSHRASCYCFKT